MLSDVAARASLPLTDGSAGPPGRRLTAAQEQVVRELALFATVGDAVAEWCWSSKPSSSTRNDSAAPPAYSTPAKFVQSTNRSH